MTRVQRMSHSNMDGGIPSPGESIRLLADEDLAEALQEALIEHDEADITEIEEDMVDIDDDLEISMHADANKFASAIGVSPTGKGKASQPSINQQPFISDADSELGLDPTDNMTAVDIEEEQAEDEGGDARDHKNIKAYLIGGGLLALLIIVIAVVSSLASKITKDPAHPESVAGSQDSVDLPERYSNDQLTPTDSLTYQDSMTINKYIEIDEDSCSFVFIGFAENARAFVKAYVDIDTYNLYRVGARVPILYEHITIGDKDYYMKVRVNT